MIFLDTAFSWISLNNSPVTVRSMVMTLKDL